MAKKKQKSEKQEDIQAKKMNSDQVETGDASAEHHAEEEEMTAGQENAADKEEKASGGNGEASAEEIHGDGSPEQEGEGTDDETGEEQAPKSEEEILQEKVAELQDRYLRLSAEYDNYRKRTLKEKMDLQDSSKQDLFIQLLPVIDDLERAMASIENATDIDAVKHGMELIYSKFAGFLNQQGVKPIEALNKELDTDQHEAITKIKVEDKKQKGKVVDVVEKGYLLRDRVIRFAKVVIGE